MRPCPSCGLENAEGAKFCSECGTALAAAPSERREERKVVSVVFVDLVGSTARAETSDPEDVRALLRVYHERARDELESFGGTVEKFIGDAVVAVFGAPAAHEDDPERAVRAALAVRDAVARLNEDEPDRDLHVRIAVNTGEALVSLDASPGEGEGMVAGDVVNTAARLQSAAPIDGILVGETTFRATERDIVYRESGAVEAKGKAEPVPAWEAVEARARLGVDLGGAGRAPLIGRDRELDLLVDALRRAREDRSTQLVTLVGVPGMGKSRLLYELARVVDEDEELITWRQGRSLPYGEGVSFWALGEIVKAQAGILESDSAGETQLKLTNAVAHVPEAGERAWVERHMRPLVGLEVEETAGDRRGEAFAAWRRFLEALAESGPTVLVFEDLHWADDGLLDFVDGLVDWVDGVPLLVVCTARPELLDRRAGWGGGKRNATTISLAPLGDDATARLVLALLDTPLVDAELQRQLVERSAGNPLYAEEFVRMLEAGGSVGGRLPDTVQGIVTARIDLLPTGEKELLQHAAVLGKVFWSDALAPLASLEPWALQEALRSLERKEFVRREHRSAVAGATQHAFQHALVRDVAYGQLPRSARVRLHLAAATWIDSLPEDRAEDRAETLAHHYLTAIELRRASGEKVGEIAAPAARALQEAGERALALNSFGVAARFLQQALDLVPTGEEPSAELLFAAGTALGLTGGLGDELERAVNAFEEAGEYERAAEAAVFACQCAWAAGGTAGASGWLERAERMLEGRPPSRAKALVLSERARLAMIDYQFETGSTLADAAIAVALDVGDDETRADALVTKGACVTNMGGGRDGIVLMEEAIEIVGGRGRAGARGYNNLGVALGALGDTRAARAIFAAALERRERAGDEQGAWFVRGNLIGGYYSSGEWDEAEAAVAVFLAAPPEFRYQAATALSVRAEIRSGRGDAAGALEDARLGEASGREMDEAQTWIPALVTLRRILRRHGADAEARKTLDEIVEVLATSEGLGDAQEWHVQLVAELGYAGMREQARDLVARMPDVPWTDAMKAVVAGDLVRAADVLQGIGELALEAELRVEAARDLVSQGRLAEAEAQLELARAFFRQAGATAYLREADEILARAS